MKLKLLKHKSFTAKSARPGGHRRKPAQRSTLAAGAGKIHSLFRTDQKPGGPAKEIGFRGPGRPRRRHWAAESEGWDPAPASLGYKVQLPPSDDNDYDGRSDAERLVEEGVNEASRNQRRHAALEE